jgi:hypothetical protein
MTYQKPEIVVLDSACAAIQSVGKFGMHLETDKEPTITAYEADD